MSPRNVYLAKYRRGTSMRAHFAIFIPNAPDDRDNISETYTSQPTKGTIIHVVGEPVIAGFHLEFKRGYECLVSDTLRQLVRLGTVDSGNLYDYKLENTLTESVPRARLEREATKVPPPRGGQNVRAPIDGINTKRCQERTMEYLQQLVSSNFIDASAIEKAQAQRDTPEFGIFGANTAGPSTAP